MMKHTAYPSSLHIPLNAIKGIGPAKTNRLQQSLGIEFAEQLVGQDVEDIFQKLAETGPQIPRREIQQWLVQALRLVKAHEGEVSKAVEEGPQFSDLEADAPKPAPQTHGDRQPTGHFEIAREGQQLRIRNTIEGPNPLELKTSNPEELYDWIQAQLTPSSPVAEATDHIYLPQWRIEITKVEIDPLETAPSIQLSPSQNYLAKGTPFVVGVNFQITGEPDPLKPTPAIATAQFSMRNRLTGETIPLGTTQGPLPRTDTARLQSPPATLNNPGVYQLQAVITLQGQEAAAGYRELQLVKVL